MKKLFYAKSAAAGICFMLIASAGNVFGVEGALNIDEKKAENIVVNAISSPQYAFPDAKTLYIKTVEKIELSLDSDALKDANNEMITEFYWQKDKFRISVYQKASSLNLQAHTIFDGKFLITISNGSPRQKSALTQEEAETLLTLGKETDMLSSEHKYKFLRMEKVSDRNCYVIEKYLDTNQGNLFKTVYFIDEKTNIIMRKEDSNLIAEVKKVEKVYDKYVPILVEEMGEDSFKKSTSYIVKVNEEIDPDIFDDTKIGHIQQLNSSISKSYPFLNDVAMWHQFLKPPFNEILQEAAARNAEYKKRREADKKSE
ncbi:MAG: hypothetical protein LBQ47_01045 [Endomicrobium sp.]|jgi:hypothetical protein|nr:hypothetical protein [Endomicrobium sp.]